MIESVITLVSGGIYNIQDFLYEAEYAGIFSYVLPFLLIFAIIFGILSRMKLFEQSKSVNGIIALVVGLLALQFEFVPVFFSEIFPRLGVGLAIILAVIILLGLFIPYNQSWSSYVMLGIGALILVIILVKTAGAVNWSAGWWWEQNWPTVAVVVTILIIIGIIVGGSRTTQTPAESLFTKLLQPS